MSVYYMFCTFEYTNYVALRVILFCTIYKSYLKNACVIYGIIHINFIDYIICMTAFTKTMKKKKAMLDCSPPIT